VFVPLPRWAGASVLRGVLKCVRDLCRDLCSEFGVRGLVEGCREGSVVLFEELGELLEGLVGLGDGGWAFEESEGFVCVSLLEKVCYTCNALFVSLSLLALDLFRSGGARVSVRCSRIVGFVFH